MNDNAGLEILKRSTARVLYYSCLAEPKTIPEITRAWNYKSTAYFYQKPVKEILDLLLKHRLIEILETSRGGGRIQSRYDMFIEGKELINFFDEVNLKIECELIVDEYDFEISFSQLQDKLFREFCLRRKPKLRKKIEIIKFSTDEAKTLSELWKNPMFSKIFLNINCITIIFNRYNLPEDPRFLLLGLTSALCHSIYEYEKQELFASPPFIYLFFPHDIEDILPSVLNNIEIELSSSNDKFVRKLFKTFWTVYDIIKRKIAVYNEVEEISSYHIRRFKNIMDKFKPLEGRKYEL